jgi:hypothetical protein
MRIDANEGHGRALGIFGINLSAVSHLLRSLHRLSVCISYQNLSSILSASSNQATTHLSLTMKNLSFSLALLGAGIAAALPNPSAEPHNLWIKRDPSEEAVTIWIKRNPGDEAETVWFKRGEAEHNA